MATASMKYGVVFYRKGCVKSHRSWFETEVEKRAAIRAWKKSCSGNFCVSILVLDD